MGAILLLEKEIKHSLHNATTIKAFQVQDFPKTPRGNSERIRMNRIGLYIVSRRILSYAYVRNTLWFPLPEKTMHKGELIGRP